MVIPQYRLYRCMVLRCIQEKVGFITTKCDRHRGFGSEPVLVEVGAALARKDRYLI